MTGLLVIAPISDELNVGMGTVGVTGGEGLLDRCLSQALARLR